MSLYTQQASSSPRPLSLVREEADQAQSKNGIASTEETPSSSEMDDILLLDIMQATDPTYPSLGTLLPLENESTAARHQERDLLSTPSGEQLKLSSMALDEFPSLQSRTLISSRNSSDPSMTICSSSSSSHSSLSSFPSTNNCTTATLPMEDSTSIPVANPGMPTIPLLPSFPHAKAAKLLSSRNINNSTDFFLDSGIAGAAEGESPPPWLWEAYRRASVAAVESLLKEQRNHQRLLMEQQQQIEQMKLQILQARAFHQQSSSSNAPVNLDFHPQLHHRFHGSLFQQPDQEQAPPLFWPRPSTPSSSPSQFLETQTGSLIVSPSLSSTTSASPRASKHRRHDGKVRQYGIARRASQGASISGPSKGSATMARSKSAVNSPSIGSRSAMDKESSPPYAEHTLSKAPDDTSPRAHTPLSLISHLELLQDLNLSASASNAESTSASDADSAMVTSPDFAFTDMDLTALPSVGMPFDFSGQRDGIHQWDDWNHSPTGSVSSRSPSPSASPSLSPTPSFFKSSSSTPAVLPSSSTTTPSNVANDTIDQNNAENNPAQSFLCPIPTCNKSFSRPINLTAHLKTHESPKPFACHLCERVFSRKHDLQRHIRVHTGSKPYICLNMNCQKAFARTDALCRHYKVEEQCRRVVIQLQILENESRERERGKKEQLNVPFAATGQGSGHETKETRGHGNLRKWQQFLVRQLMQQESVALEKARILQTHQRQQQQQFVQDQPF